METTSVAAYGEATLPIAQTTRLTGGIRFNHDRKSYDSRFAGNGFPGTVGFFAEDGDLNFAYVTGRVSLAQDLGPQQAIVATVTRGEKSGGFPRLVTNAALGGETSPFLSTQIMAYEVGYRQATADGLALAG